MRDDNQVLVRVNGVSKKFCRDLKKSLLYGLKDSARDLFSFGRKITDGRHKTEDEIPSPICDLRSSGGEAAHPFSFSPLPPSSDNEAQAFLHGHRNDEDILRPGEFYAVKDISFELQRGECLGLIGRNGAGKTTLLKMLNGLIKPDAGRIEMRGRVGALIALGAGFNPILTGRENIYVNGSILGITKEEIDRKIDDIIEFAEIRAFIDAPVQSYSSGMQVRLGFAVATALNPDVLILDEVLAVGDSAFRFKCYRAIDSLLKNTAVIIVSHNMPDIMRICNKVLLVKNGKVEYFGPKEDGVCIYEKLSEETNIGDAGFVRTSHPVTHFDVFAPEIVESSKPFSFKYTVGAIEEIKNLKIIINFFNESQQYACNAFVSAEEFGVTVLQGKSEYECTVTSLPLKPGKYKIAIHLLSDREFVASHSKKLNVSVTGGYFGSNADCIIIMDNWRLINCES